MNVKWPSFFNTFRHELLHVVYPNFCLVCSTEIVQSNAAVCPICIHDFQYTLFEKYTTPTPLDQLFWGRVKIAHTYSLLFFSKGNSTQVLLHELKYKNRADVALYLGEELAKKLTDMPQFSDVELLIPVPLHPKKEFIRGYNQAEELAKGIARILPIPINTTLLKRTVFSESQTKKGKMLRWDTMQERFSATETIDNNLKHIALVDDVVTTGSTLEICVRLLQERFPTVKISIITVAFVK